MADRVKGNDFIQLLLEFLDFTGVISISEAWPSALPIGWWIRIRECFRAVRLPFSPAHIRMAPMEAAIPVQDRGNMRVDILHGVVRCQAPAYTEPPGVFR